MDTLPLPRDPLPDFLSSDPRQQVPAVTLPTASPSAAGTVSSSPTIYSPDHDTELGNTHVQTTSTALPPSVGAPAKLYSKWFWARGDSALHRARVIYLKGYLGGLFLVVLAIFAVFPIYWGSLWKVPAHKMQGWIVVRRFTSNLTL